MNEYEKIKVSIVIPVYNVDRYLVQCIESVTTQTYRNIEIILINDGSTDDSSKIASSHAEKDSRIKLIHKENGGLSDARNAGIKVATGEYIMFLDSDDYATEDFVESSLDATLKSKADITCFRFTSVTDGGEIIKISSKKSTANLDDYSSIDAIKDVFTLGGTLKVNAWNKIYKRSLFTDNSIEYPFGKIYEDNQTTYKLMYFAKKIIFLDKSLLFYRQRPGSIMRGRLTNDNIKERFGMIDDTLVWLKPKIKNKETKKINKIYRKTMFTVLASEAIKKRQIKMLPKVALGFIKRVY